MFVRVRLWPVALWARPRRSQTGGEIDWPLQNGGVDEAAIKSWCSWTGKTAIGIYRNYINARICTQSGTCRYNVTGRVLNSWGGTVMIERFLRVASAVSRVHKAAPQAAPSPLGKGTGCVLHSSVTLQPVILFYLILCYLLLVQTLKNQLSCGFQMCIQIIIHVINIDNHLINTYSFKH